MKIVAIDALGYGPWEGERRMAAALGVECEVVSYEDFCAQLPQGEVVVNGGGWPITRAMLDQMPQCRLIVGFGTGMDWIDRADVEARGIVLTRTPLANVEDVATHALTLILACVRKVLESDRRVRRGDFDLTGYSPIHRVKGRRIGLVSFGNVPRRLSEMLQPLGAEIRSYDPHVSAESMAEFGVQQSGLDDLLRWAQVLSIHTPLTEETSGLVSEREFRLMPAGGVVVVTSRGGVYDAEALAEALIDGHVAAAGVDVFPVEPLPDNHPLFLAPNTILTPHIAGYSEGAIEDYHAAAMQAARSYMEEHLSKLEPAPVVGAEP